MPALPGPTEPDKPTSWSTAKVLDGLAGPGGTQALRPDAAALAPQPLWMDVPLTLPDGVGKQALHMIRIEPGVDTFGVGTPLVLNTPAQARAVTTQLLAHPASTARLLSLRGGSGGTRFGLDDWTLHALAERELTIFIRPRPYGFLNAPPPVPPRPRPEDPRPKRPDDVTHWIEIQLNDDKGKVVPNAAYIIVTADKQRHTGSTDKLGKARLDGIVAGPCDVSFPELDDEEWKRA